MLHVETDNADALLGVMQAANDEAARTGPQKGPTP
jgi:hypothetical protein